MENDDRKWSIIWSLYIPLIDFFNSQGKHQGQSLNSTDGNRIDLQKGICEGRLYVYTLWPLNLNRS